MDTILLKQADNVKPTAMNGNLIDCGAQNCLKTTIQTKIQIPSGARADETDVKSSRCPHSMACHDSIEAG